MVCVYGGGYDPATDYIVYNWHVHPFTCSGLDQLLRMFSVSVYLYNVFWGGIVLFTVSMDLLKKYQERKEREMRTLAAKEG